MVSGTQRRQLRRRVRLQLLQRGMGPGAGSDALERRGRDGTAERPPAPAPGRLPGLERRPREARLEPAGDPGSVSAAGRQERRRQHRYRDRRLRAERRPVQQYVLSRVEAKKPSRIAYIVFDEIPRSTAGLRPAVPPDHGHRGRPAQHRLGRRAPLVRAALLPARRRIRMRSPGHRRLGLHRLPRRRPAARRGPRAADLRHARVAVPRRRRRRDVDRRPARRARAARARPTAATRSSISPPPPTSAIVAQGARAAGGSSTRAARCNVLEAARATGARVHLRLDDLGLLRRRARARSTRTRALAPARAPLHRHEARRRDVLPLLRRALRRRVDDPALRDPLRPARPPGGRAADLRRARRSPASR